MPRIVICLLLIVASGLCHDCFEYGAPVTLRGTLYLRDQAGYVQFIVLKPEQAVCIESDPRQTGVTEIQAGAYGAAESDALPDRLDRLIGHRVIVKGELLPATTGYHRTNVQLRVEGVDPIDQDGQQALRSPKAPFRAKDVGAYDVTVNAGPRLVIEAHERASNAPLLPADEYAPRFMTGGDVLYLNCRIGYSGRLISTTEKDGGISIPGELYGLPAFPKQPIIVKFRCTKNR
jgi:hypothetical protein